MFSIIPDARRKPKKLTPTKFALVIISWNEEKVEDNEEKEDKKRTKRGRRSGRKNEREKRKFGKTLELFPNKEIILILFCVCFLCDASTRPRSSTQRGRRRAKEEAPTKSFPTTKEDQEPCCSLSFCWEEPTSCCFFAFLFFLPLFPCCPPPQGQASRCCEQSSARV